MNHLKHPSTHRARTVLLNAWTGTNPMGSAPRPEALQPQQTAMASILFEHLGLRARPQRRSPAGHAINASLGRLVVC
jgi:hypothetical protein